MLAFVDFISVVVVVVVVFVVVVVVMFFVGLEISYTNNLNADLLEASQMKINVFRAVAKLSQD